jgi:hypothetical protein
LKFAFDILKKNLEYYDTEIQKIEDINNKKKLIVNGIKEMVSYRNLLN